MSIVRHHIFYRHGKLLTFSSSSPEEPIGQFQTNLAQCIPGDDLKKMWADFIHYFFLITFFTVYVLKITTALFF